MTTAHSHGSAFQVCREPAATREGTPAATVAHWVERILIDDRPPLRATEPTRILGQLLHRRLEQGGDAPSAEETAMRAALETWHARRSHALEWINIGLIALDIVIHTW